MAKQPSKYTVTFEFEDGTVKRYNRLEFRGVRHNGQRPVHAMVKCNVPKESYQKDHYIKKFIYMELINVLKYIRTDESQLTIIPKWFEEAVDKGDINERSNNTDWSLRSW